MPLNLSIFVCGLLATSSARADDRLAGPSEPPPPIASGHVARFPAPEPGVAAQLDALADDWDFGGAALGVQLVDVSTGEEVFARNADVPLNPASTMKVITAAVALKSLGPAYRFSTDVWTTQAIDAQGRLDGDLYIQGHGDPTFVIERMWKLVEDLRTFDGLQKISGDVVFDDAFFSDSALLPGWDKADDLRKGPSYFSTLGALSLNHNTAVLVVGPGTKAGQSGFVGLETPAPGYVAIENRVITTQRGTRRRVEVERTVSDEGTTFTVKGTVPLGVARQTYRRTIAHPTAHWMAVFARLLKDKGIEVGGSMRRGDVPRHADRLRSTKSPYLSRVLMDMNKHSLNFTAEQVLRVLGAELHDEGSTQAGLRVVADYLRDLGLHEDAATLVNGSGLSRHAALAPSTLTAVLVDMARDPTLSSEFETSLALGGVDGTLWSRLRDEPGKLRAKTGTIDGVQCLSGYIDSGSGRRYAFAFLVNEHKGKAQDVRDAHDAFARQMFRVGTPNPPP